MGNRARGGREVLGRVLGVDAALDRVAVPADVVLAEADRLARGDQDLLAHDVDARDGLGHAVLDLHARVHLQEEVLAVLGQQALDRARAAVVNGLRGLSRDLADALAQLLVDQGRRRLLDQLLMAALDRAVALAEVDHVAVAVGQDLDLDVPRIRQVALEVDGGVREELLALARGALEGVLELVGLERDPEALAAAAARGLHGDRVADLLGDPLRVLERLDGVRRARHDRDAGVLHELARLGLGAHRLDCARRRADEGDPLLLEAAREGGVLGEEAVAGVNGLRAGLLDHLDQLVDVQIRLRRGPGAEQEGLGGALDVLRLAVGLRVHRDGLDAQLVERPDDANGDLTAVGDQHPCKHQRRAMLSARLVLIRHGQSTYNAQGRLQGQADPPLSAAGRAEAERLKPCVPRFERAITSDLVRASETAALLGYPDAVRDVRWREIDLGEWAGRAIAEFSDETAAAWRGGPLNPPGGESWKQFAARVGGAVDELVRAGGTWLVVCHGGAVRAAVSHVTGADPTRIAGPANASVTVVRSGSRPRLEAYAWTPALSGS